MISFSKFAISHKLYFLLFLVNVITHIPTDHKYLKDHPDERIEEALEGYMSNFWENYNSRGY